MSDTPRTDAIYPVDLLDRGIKEHGRTWGWGAVSDFRDLARQLERELTEATSENNQLRAALASSNDPCLYCQLPKDEMTKCRSGFPGCARADDLMGCPELGSAFEAERLERELAEAKIGAARYKYIRKLTIHQYGALMRDCMTWDLNFDAEVDRRRNEK